MKRKQHTPTDNPVRIRRHYVGKAPEGTLAAFRMRDGKLYAFDAKGTIRRIPESAIAPPDPPDSEQP